MDGKVRIALLEQRLADERTRADDGEREDRAEDPAPARRPEPGLRVGEYVLETRIGEGGFGEVWKARHAVLDQLAAIKIPTHEAYIANLRRLGRLQHRIDDPRVVKVLGADLDARPPYLAMEYVEGRDLRRLLRDEKRLAPARALRLLEEIGLAVKAAHDAGVVHRDLKPENILVERGDRVKVTDFELGRARREAERPVLVSADLASVAAASGVVGTLAYMAPEQHSGADVDARADIYALGIIFFEMLTGERPHPGDKPTDLVQGLPVGCDGLFERCFARLEKRFASVDELIEAGRGISKNLARA